MKQGRFQRSNLYKTTCAKIYVGKSTSLKNLLFCAQFETLTEKLSLSQTCGEDCIGDRPLVD